MSVTLSNPLWMEKPMVFHCEDRKFVFEGDVISDGRNGKVDLTELAEENKGLRRRVEELELKVQMLWDSPGMPGCIQAKQRWDAPPNDVTGKFAAA